MGTDFPEKEYLGVMKRPSKKDIKAALDLLKSPAPLADVPPAPPAALQPKKSNKNRIRKQGV